MASCTKKKGCKASMHYAACPSYSPRMNDDASYNRSNLTIDDAMKLGMWDLVPSERGDSMG
jgi:hypothetical protein